VKNTRKYRQAFVPIAQRLLDLGALRDGLDVNQTVDVFWFYFGYAGLFTCTTKTGGLTSALSTGFLIRHGERCSATPDLERGRDALDARKRIESLVFSRK
jgi:hypothetical protein